jgi:NAD(P)H-hydrate epimerase
VNNRPEYRSQHDSSIYGGQVRQCYSACGDSNGELSVANIGTPQELIDEQPSQLYLSEKRRCASWLRRTEFSTDSYKNKRGHAFLIAGSENYSGAAVLAGNASMRSGVGLVTLACPSETKPLIAPRLLPEVILTSIESEIDEHIDKADAIAIGCGLDANDPKIEALVRRVVSERKVPTIVDAGALWFFSPMQRPDREGGRNQDVDSNALADARASATEVPLILTPHEGEFLRLLGTDDKDAIKDRVAAVREFSKKHDVILVLKGERVLMGEPGGKLVVNPTGNSGLGKAGTAIR